MKKINTLISLFCLILLFNESTLASEAENRAELKQEILQELLQSDALKQQIVKQIKLYELEKITSRKNHQQQRQNKILQQAKKNLRPVDPAIDHIYGHPDAAVTIIEFSDFECPYCRKIHPVLKRLVKNSKQQVNWVYRHYPLAFHQPNASLEAEAAECAGAQIGTETFWKFTEALFQQSRRGKKNRDSAIKKAADRAAIDYEKFQLCIKAGTYREKVKNDEKEALAIGLRGTPANILIHNKTGKVLLRQGAASSKTLNQDIASLMDASK